ncbi:MAG: pantoate--beta-alanine ligase [Bryobacteraceae bacterium]
MSTSVVRTIAELRAARAAAPGRVAVVPTMGALHAGHGCLIEAARSAADFVIVPIFVNPIQFDRADDFEKYHRDLPADVEFCRARGADLVFAPDVEEMYQRPHRTFVEVERLGDTLCGQHRAGHFRGVATVVLKLFHLTQPDIACFGEKDAQQLAIIRRMVRDLNVPVEIVEVPTVREPDGLALSSRNRRLTPEQRQNALVLYRALRRASDLIREGEADPARLRREAEAMVTGAPDARLEYFEVVDPEEMQPVERISGPVRVAGALWMGATRLIDNLLCTPPDADKSSEV